MIKAKIRYSCVTLPIVDSDALAFQYVRALQQTSLGVRILPVGLMHFGIAPWNQVSKLFITTLAAEYINVVCVPPSTSMGCRIKASDFEPRAPDPNKVVYEPSTAIQQLFTAGVPNVAILSGKLLPSEDECLILGEYDLVVCPSVEGQRALHGVGVCSEIIPSVPAELMKAFSVMT